MYKRLDINAVEFLKEKDLIEEFNFDWIDKSSKKEVELWKKEKKTISLYRYILNIGVNIYYLDKGKVYEITSKIGLFNMLEDNIINEKRYFNIIKEYPELKLKNS